MKREEIFEYVKKVYGTIPEYLWSRYPSYAVLRVGKTGKWYAVLMNVPAEKLGMEGQEGKEILNVKCDPEMVDFLIQSDGFLPAYHMDKKNWISILLDGTVDEIRILDFLDRSYEKVEGGRKFYGRKETGSV